jgi:hypothetical protein
MPDTSTPSVNHGITNNSGPSIKKLPITLEFNFASNIIIYKLNGSIAKSNDHGNTNTCLKY